MPRNSTPLAVAVALAVAALFPPASRGDEGMWTYDNFPKAAVAKEYGFAPDQAWLDSARLSSVRLAGGCSGSFVSADGLVMTNHHCARACISQLSNKQHDYLANGFYAPAADAEQRCPEIELDELLSMTDVTARIGKATKGLKIGSPESERAQQVEESAIEKECAGGDKKLLCQVVSFYHGGIYQLYKYRRYQDVRLVFAPELNVPKFGGDPDNFEFPRWSLDMAFLRAWDEGKPAHPEHWFRWSAAGPKEGELTFVSGNPGSTRRLYTVAQYIYERDYAIPERLLDLAEQRGQLTIYAGESADRARGAGTELLSLENSYKGLRGRLEALTDPKFMPAKLAAEEKLRAAVKKKLGPKAAEAWDELAKAVEQFRPHRKEYAFLEGTSSAAPGAIPSWTIGVKLLRFARLLVRGAAETKKPDADRLREWGDARLPSVQQALASTAPISKHLEIVRLTYGLTKLREQLGTSHPFVKKVLGDKSPAELAAELINGTRLEDPAVRKLLLDGGEAAIEASTDPAIVLMRAVDGDGRTIRKWFEDDILARENAATESIARSRFALEGSKVYPDATFSLRLSYGAVKGWSAAGHTVAPFTDFAGAFAHQTGRDPFQLPASWNAAKAKLDGAVPFDFCTDNDIIGGNSGSPAFNQQQEITGLIFDGNLASLGGDYGFDESENRAVAADSAAILQALDKVYGATRVLDDPPGPSVDLLKDLPRSIFMIFRQLFDQTSSTYSYLLADETTREAVLIDSVFEQHTRDAALLRELELKLLYVLDTHCHADHVTGAFLMKEALGCRVCLSKEYQASNVDRPLAHGDQVVFGSCSLEVRATPGHTAGCLSFINADHKLAFTGDALLVRSAGRTDFQEGDPHLLFRSIREQLFTLPGDCIVYPAHDYEGRTSSTIDEEKRFNPRIGGGAREEDFVGYMKNLALPHPKQLAVAVPANLRSGQPEDGKSKAAPQWGPVVTTYAGLPEIEPEWVARHRKELHILDVRNPAELDGELGHLEQAQSIPLDELRARLSEISKEKPVVVVCQTGRRAALGAMILSKAGFTQIANLAGGMVRWRDLGLPS